MTKIQRFFYSPNNFIAYKSEFSKLKRNLPGIIFVHGFRSDMNGDKVIAVESYAKKHDLSFIKFDCRNHGESSGDKNEGSISTWLEDLNSVITNLTLKDQKQILIGSSMGGWLILLAALKNPEKIHGLLGLASAPDFTKDLMWDKLSTSEQTQLLEQGSLKLKADWCTSEYLVTKELIEDAKQHLLLHKPSINIDYPIRLLHGMNDTDVPFDTSITLAKKLLSKRIKLSLIKDGDHRLSRTQDIDLLLKELDELLNIKN
ncbi:MAG: alpha/beta hydrolase [Sphingobacteriia bacterium]|nr:alpha/beta hydrolase [Sphingobacteriia bacterium]